MFDDHWCCLTTDLPVRPLKHGSPGPDFFLTHGKLTLNLFFGPRLKTNGGQLMAFVGSTFDLEVILCTGFDE